MNHLELPMSLLLALVEFLSEFPSSGHFSSSGFCPLDLSGLGDPPGRIATAGLSLKVTGTHEQFYHVKVVKPQGVCDVNVFTK